MTGPWHYCARGEREDRGEGGRQGQAGNPAITAKEEKRQSRSALATARGHFSANLVFASKNLIKKLNNIQRLCNNQLTDGTDHVSSINYVMDCMRRFDGAYTKIKFVNYSFSRCQNKVKLPNACRHPASPLLCAPPAQHAPT